jgi:Cytochrome bd terminal oxidase subunit I
MTAAFAERGSRDDRGDPLVLSRVQFAWVVSFHFLLPAFTVGLASFIAVVEGLHLATGHEIYFRVSMFWIKIFAAPFGMGVVSGIVMPFQFGTNWSRFSDASATSSRRCSPMRGCSGRPHHRPRRRPSCLSARAPRARWE